MTRASWILLSILLLSESRHTRHDSGETQKGTRVLGGAPLKEGFLFLLVLLEGSHEGDLVLVGLEATVTELAAGVDELEADLLQGTLLGVDQQRLPG